MSVSKTFDVLYSFCICCCCFFFFFKFCPTAEYISVAAVLVIVWQVCVRVFVLELSGKDSHQKQAKMVEILLYVNCHSMPAMDFK